MDVLGVATPRRDSRGLTFSDSVTVCLSLTVEFEHKQANFASIASVVTAKINDKLWEGQQIQGKYALFRFVSIPTTCKRSWARYGQQIGRLLRPIEFNDL